jgi:hypothetical protein
MTVLNGMLQQLYRCSVSVIHPTAAVCDGRLPGAGLRATLRAVRRVEVPHCIRRCVDTVGSLRRKSVHVAVLLAGLQSLFEKELEDSSSVSALNQWDNPVVINNLKDSSATAASATPDRHRTLAFLACSSVGMLLRCVSGTVCGADAGGCAAGSYTLMEADAFLRFGVPSPAEGDPEPAATKQSWTVHEPVRCVVLLDTRAQSEKMLRCSCSRCPQSLMWPSGRSKTRCKGCEARF